MTGVRTFHLSGALAALGLISILGATTQPAAAATYTWDAAGAGNILTMDGSGTWNTVSGDWWNVSTSGDQAWNNSTDDTAVFGVGSPAANAYTVNLGAGITVGGIAFQNQSYTLSGNTLTFAGSSPTVSVNATGGTIGSVVAGSAGLTMTGPGLLTLTATNIYSGTTTVSGGTLQLGTGAAGQDGVIGGAVKDNGMLSYDLAGSQSLGSVISGSGAMTLAGGTLTLGTGNVFDTYTGGTTVNGGLLLLNNNGNGTGTVLDSVTVNAGGTVRALGDAFGYNSGHTVTSLTINGGDFDIDTLGVTVTGVAIGMTGGSLSTSFAGGRFDMYVNGFGNTSLTTSAASTTAVVSAAIRIRESNPTITVAAGSTPSGIDLLISGPISYITGSGNLTKAGNGLLALTGSNTYTSGTTVSAGTLQIGAGGAAGSLSPSSAIVDNGTLAFNLGSNATQGSQFASGAISGTGGLSQLGPGTLTLNAANTYTGGTSIAGGTLAAATIVPSSSASNLGNNTTAIVLGNNSGVGTLEYTGNSASFAPGLAINPGGGNLFVATSGQTLSLGGISGSGAMTIDGAGNTVVTGAVQGGIASFTAASTGAVILAGNNTYTGSTAITGGKLYLNGTNATTTIALAGGATLGGSGSALSASANVADGGILDFSQNAGGAFALGGLSFAGGATIDLDDSGGQYATTPVISAGTVSTSSSIINLNVGNVPQGTGTMEILQYAGSIGGAGSSAFNLASPANTGRSIYSLINVGNTIELSYSVDYPFWTGAGNLSWDVSSTGNWAANSNSASTTFIPADNVVFDDRAIAYSGTAQVVNINAANVAPASVTFSNTASSYLLQGTGSIVGAASLTVNGAGSVTIAISNSYTGGTTVSGGTVNANASYALGSGPVTIGGGLLNDGAPQSLGSGPLYISGGTLNANYAQSSSSVTLNAGVLNANGAGALGAGPVSVSGGLLQDNAAFSLGAGTLSISGGVVNVANTQSLASVALGGTGLLQLAGSAALGSSPLTLCGGTLDNTSGASMTLAGNSTQNWNGSFTFLGSSPLNIGTGAVTMNASPTVFVNASTLTVGGAISGSGALTKDGGGVLVLAAANGYTGATTISAGTLQLGTGAAGQDGSLATSGVVDNASLVYNLSGAQSPGYAISGSGSVCLQGSGVLTLGNGNVFSSYTGGTVVAGGVLALANNNNGTGTIQGSLTIDSSGTVSALGDALGYNSGQTVTSLTINGGVFDIDTLGITVTGVPIAMTGGTISGSYPGARLDMFTTGSFGNTSLTTYPSATTAVIAANIRLRENNPTITVASGSTPAGIDLLISGAISDDAGSGSLIIAGNGVLALAGSNTYTRGTTISGGTLQLGTGIGGQDGSIAGTSGVVNNAALVYDVVGVQTAGYPITGSGSVAMIGSGFVELTAANGYSGGTSIASGVLQLGNAGALGTGNLAANGGVLDLGGYSVTVPSFSGAAGVVTNSAYGSPATLDVNQSGSTSFGGTLADGASQVALQVDSGTLTLSGNNTYTGGTLVDDTGTLILTNNEALADGSSLIVGDASAFASIQPASAGSNASSPLGAEVAAVPEPGTFILVAFGLFVAGFFVKRRKT